MAKIGSLAWHKQRIKEIEEAKSKAGKLGAKSRVEKHFSFKEGYGNTQKMNTKPPTARYRSRIEFDFLKYIRVVFKWAVENNPDLTRPKVEFLLYLYGLGAFSKKQFHDYHKLFGLYAVKALQEFEDGGWVVLWRPRSTKQHALYVLTTKGKSLCSRMHRYCCGVDELPTNPVSNKMVRKDAPRINNYYLEAIKKMNNDKALED